MKAKAGAANLITGTRILCSVALLFCPAFSRSFFLLYLAAGLTDMIDGPVARKTGTVSELGAKLDTAADCVFVAVCLWKLLPSLAVPLWLWIWIVLIPLNKMINMISGYHPSKTNPVIAMEPRLQRLLNTSALSPFPAPRQ